MGNYRYMHSSDRPILYNNIEYVGNQISSVCFWTGLLIYSPTLPPIRPARIRDPWPWHRPIDNCSLWRLETTNNLLHPTEGSNQIGCIYTWYRSVSWETNTRTSEKILAPDKRCKDVITQLQFFHTKATKSHILSQGPPTICQHCGWTLTIEHMLLECTALQQSREEYYTAD